MWRTPVLLLSYLPFVLLALYPPRCVLLVPVVPLLPVVQNVLRLVTDSLAL